MLADTAPSLRNLFPNALSLLSLSILLPLILHLLWRLLLNPQNPKPSTQAHPNDKPSAQKKSKSSFYGTPTTTPLNFTNVAPFPTSSSSSSSSPSPSPHVSTEPDRWYRDRSLISAPDRVYTPTMALRTCPFDDWLRVDTNYPARMTHKRNVLDAYGWKTVGGAMACRPEAEAAVRELLGYLGEYLPRRFPGVWVREGNGGDDDDDGGRCRLRSLVTGERFELVEPWGGLHPLEVVARVTEEDLAVLVPGKGGDGEEEAEAEYVLKAAVSAFPAGFDIQEKMDQPLTAIHEPVPTYKEKLKRAMNKFFKNVTADRLLMRVNWGINDREELFFLDGTHLYEGDEATADEKIDINQVQLRIERQVLRRLPRSGAICMLTKTYLYRLVEIAEEPGFAARLGGMLHKLPEKLAFYKRKPVWGKAVLAYLDEMAAKHPALPTDDE